MHITRVRITGKPPLVEEVSFDCDERVNLLIGPNASGKSTALSVIFHEYIRFSVFRYSSFINCSNDWPRGSNDNISDPLDAVPPWLYIPATRLTLPPPDLADRYYEQIIEYPWDGETTEARQKHLFSNISSTWVFHGADVSLAIERLRKRMPTNRGQQNQFRRALDVGYSCAKSICPEVIYDGTPHTYYESTEEDLESIVHYGMGIGTTDNILGEPLYAGALSSGTQGTLLWIYALALKMASHYEWAEGWDKRPAILLIDEIENHLHPTWQRRVIPALLEHFPGLQIFATTHSPFVVAGLKAGQVHLLNRDKNGVVTATTNTENVIGWTADEILRTMMGVDDPTDDKTAAAALKLRQLRNEGPRSTPEAEEQRQGQMQELRQLVDRDLLAGGPMAAQRELFEKQFAEALEKYRQSQTLNQENG